MHSQPYAHPPIIDAVVELRTKSAFKAGELGRMVRFLKAKYDRYDESGEVDVEVRIEGGKATPTMGKPRPIHQFRNNDQTDLCRLELKKMHWSRLPPYEGWEAFEERIDRDLFCLPSKSALPALERIGVRFQNRLDVPYDQDGVSRYEKYLSVNIALPPLLDPHAHYMWHVQKAFAEQRLGAAVTSTIIPPEIPGTAAILLDIDVFALTELPANRADLKIKLQEIRSLKNEIFEACITDKARDGFQ